MDDSTYIVSLIIAAGLAFIPANIAKNKGYSFGLWWLYGWMLWIAAIIHVNCIPDKNAPRQACAPQTVYPTAVPSVSSADELKKYKELYDQGVLTEQEFNRKKQQILNEIR